MDEILVRDALRAHVTVNEPPLGFTSADALHAGRRSQRLRAVGMTLVAGGAATAIVASAVALLPAVPAPGRGQDIASTGASDPVACAALRASSRPDQLAAGDRMTCYLLDAVPRLLPDAEFGPNQARGDTAALVAVDDSQGSFIASAMVTDTQGTGLLIVGVGRGDRSDGAAAAGRCAKPTPKAHCGTGPHGELIEVYDFGKDDKGVHGINVSVYTGNTVVLAGARNAPETQDAEPTRPTPPLTVDQLVELATAPELKLYP